MPDTPIILAPAYPGLGRLLVSGEVHWSDHVQKGIFSIKESLQQRGGDCVLVPMHRDVSLGELVQTHRAGAPTVLLCDARTQEDLDRTVEEGIATGRRVLWI